jgi:hypothetical protein
MLRHVALSAAATEPGSASVGSIGTELRRAVAMTMPGPMTTATPGAMSVRSVELWDTLGLSKEQVDDLGGRMGMTVRPSRALSSTPTVGGDDAGLYAPAVALAVATARAALPLDFSRSKLAVKPPRRSATARSGDGGGLDLLVVLVVLCVDTLQKESEVADIRAKLASMKSDVDEAKANVARIGYGRQYSTTARRRSGPCARWSARSGTTNRSGSRVSRSATAST